MGIRIVTLDIVVSMSFKKGAYSVVDRSHRFAQASNCLSSVRPRSRVIGSNLVRPPCVLPILPVSHSR
jgi:hypothetical protein